MISTSRRMNTYVWYVFAITVESERASFRAPEKFVTMNFYRSHRPRLNLV